MSGATSAEKMIESARAAGVRDGEPDGLFVASMAVGITVADDAATRIEAATGSVLARLDSSDQTTVEKFERHLRQVSAEALKDAAKAIVVSYPLRTAAVVAGLMVLATVGALYVGWEAGYTTASQRTAWTAVELQAAFRGGLPGADWLADVVKWNDLAGVRKECQSHQWSAVGGGMGCTVQVRISASSVGEKR